MAAPLKNRAIMVLGMHRSGTSAFTGVLNLLGVELGSKLLPASATNQSGYWEHEEVVDANDQLLIALGSSWDDPSRLPAEWWKTEVAAGYREKLVEMMARDFAGARLWALKDPRLCKLMPLWISILEELECEPTWVLIARHPSESIRSLESRQGIPRQKSELLWLQYTLEAELETRGRNRVVITYDALLDDWAETMGKVERAMGVNWAVAPESVAGRMGEFLDPGKRHHRVEESGELSEWTREAYAGLLAGALGDEEKMRGALDRARAAYYAADALYSPVIRAGATELAGRREKYRVTKEKLAAASAELKARKEQMKQFERSAGGKLNRALGKIKKRNA